MRSKDDNSSNDKSILNEGVKTPYLPLNISPEIIDSLTPEETKAMLKDLLKYQVELKKHDEKHFSYFDSTFVAINFFELKEDNSLVLTQYNPASEKITGIDYSALRGLTIEKAFPNLVDTHIPDMYRSIARGELESQLYEIHYGDDRFSRWFEISAFRIGESTVGVEILDIRERKLAEIELRYQASLIEQVDIAIITINFDNIILSWNDHAELLYQWKKNEAIGKNIIELLGANELKKETLQNFVDLNRDGHWEGEYAVKRKDSTSIPVHIVNTYLKDDNGENIGFIGLSTDISERRQAEKALIESEYLYKETQRIGKIGGWSYDVESEQSTFTDIIYEIYGKKISTAEEGIQFYHPDDKEIVWNSFNEIITKQKPYDLEVRLINAQGDSLFVRTIGQPIIKNGKVVKIYGNLVDITEHKKLESQVLQAQKIESIGLLAGGIAHDFNNILSGIFGYMEMALEETSEEIVSTYLTHSLSSLDRARALTRQLLTFAKGGAPIIKVENLFPFVQETVEFALSGSSVLSRFQIQKNLWSCNFDKNQISQVVNNLTINALQSMPNGGTIVVTARNVSISEEEHILLDSGSYMKLSITDQGIGIPKESLPLIFDPYFSTKSKGQGLGLASCYSIMKRHGGYLEVESELGKGSTFHLYLPVSFESISTSNVNLTKKHTGSGTFLIMEDEEPIRDIMKKMLESFGYTVVLKENGKDAIDFVTAEIKENRKLSGMIFDLTIPGGMGGKKAIREIRKICSDTPVFVSSGYSEDPIMANPKKYGFTASLCKPFTIADLSQMLEENLKNQ